MKLCKVLGCGRKSHCKGLCNTHYQRLRRTGSPQVHVLVKRRSDNHGATCTEPGCNRPYKAKGLCRRCYDRRWYHEKARDPEFLAHKNELSMQSYRRNRTAILAKKRVQYRQNHAWRKGILKQKKRQYHERKRKRIERLQARIIRRRQNASTRVRHKQSPSA